MKNYISIFFALTFTLITLTISGQDPFCNYTQTSLDATIVFPEEATLTVNGIPLDSGSIISATVVRADTILCVGSIEYTGEASALTIYGQDGGDQGMMANEAFRFMAQLPDGCIVIQREASFLSGNIYTTDSIFQVNGISGMSAIEFENNFFVTAEVTPSSSGGSDGQIRLSVEGGIPPYRFEWSDKSLGTAQQIEGVPAGTYHVKVFDKYGCMQELQLEVTSTTAINKSKGTNPNIRIYAGRDGKLILQPFDLATQLLQIQVFNMHGQMIADNKIRVFQGEQTKIVHPGINIPGTYIVVVSGEQFWFSTKVFFSR